MSGHAASKALYDISSLLQPLKSLRISRVLPKDLSLEKNVNFRSVMPFHHNCAAITHHGNNHTPENVTRGLYTSSGPLNRERFIADKVSTVKLRGKIYDESDNIQENLDALTSTQLAADATEAIQEDIKKKDEEESFQLYPDETTADRLFNGIKLVTTHFLF